MTKGLSTVLVLAAGAALAAGVEGVLDAQVLATGSGRVLLLSKRGEVVREHKADNPHDAWMLPNGNILAGCYSAYTKDGAGTGMFEITREKKLVWRYVSPSLRDKSMMAVQKCTDSAGPPPAR